MIVIGLIKTNDRISFYIQLLKQTIQSFQQLTAFHYEIHVARKGTKNKIKLYFYPGNFVHLSGINKLSDISIVLKTPNIYHRIARGDIKSKRILNHLIVSNVFPKITNRLISINKLKENFDKASDNKHYKFVSKERGYYTSIDYDFIIKCFDIENTYYYFLRRSGETDGYINCVVVSTFIENTKGYTKGQAFMTLLFKSRVNNVTKEERVIYDKRNKSFKT